MKTILVPIDLAHESGLQKTVDHAVALARMDGAELHALTVIPDYGMSLVGSFFPKNFSENAVKETTAALEAFVAAHFPADMDVTEHVRHGTIYEQIIEVANGLKADMIVMASHRPEMSDYLLGPNAARVVRHARQSVTVIR
ncbi:universal stress protein [Marimonas arenosa]|uniref:Universal stress protein n=1 Tax=Marimonas arenosa TaxID=1795305 RepID=A0AAE4B5D3_9RHOB|nr:universal stress protein [Marimonas arenosa]MDQ2090229.1 universal stress protein [Marimonas arenosa]